MTDDKRDPHDAPRGERRPMPPSIQPKSRQVRPGSQPGPGAAPGHDDVRRRSVIPQGAPPARPQQQRPGAQRPATQQRPAQAPQAPRPPQQQRTGQASHRPPATAPRRKRHRLRNWAIGLLVALVLVLIGVYVWVDGQINHVDALSGAPGTPGRTTLIVGSDSRDGWDQDGTEGARTDTIMLLHSPEDGPTALISIPRDSYVEIPGNGANKINAAFAWGGPTLLVETVEELTGLTVDHYMEVGFNGVGEVVDALDGVRLCYDQDVDDKLSRLKWKAGCHRADGATALAFARMRYSDPLGDIGRTQRQQQVVSKVANKVFSPGTILNPFTMKPVIEAGLDAFGVSNETGPIDLAAVALDFNSARGADAVTGTPPIADLGYSVDGVGSTVLLDPDEIDRFWKKIRNGTYKPGTEVGGIG